MGIQNSDFTMVGLGSDGQPPAWFGPPLEKGVHLRWAFQPQLGFPHNGFTLYRRAHSKGSLLDLIGQDLSSPVISFPETVRRVEADFSYLSHLPGGSVEPPPVLLGFNENIQLPIDSDASVISGHATVTLEHEAVTAIRVEYQSQSPRSLWHLDSIHYVPVSQDVDDPNHPWTPLGNICLPITDPNYPCHPGNPNDTADWQDASGRIPGLVRSHYLGDPASPSEDWEHLHKSLLYLYNPPIPGAMVTEAPADSDSPRQVVSLLDLLLPATIDPYLARVIGLYWVDKNVVTSNPLSGVGKISIEPSYDYKIEGHWSRDQIAWPEDTVDFEPDRIGRILRRVMERNDLILRLPDLGRIISTDGVPWRDTGHALELKSSNTDSILSIHFQKPVIEAQLYLRIFGGRPALKAFLASGTVAESSNLIETTWYSSDRQFAVITARVSNKDESLEFISLYPDGGEELHAGLCKIGLISTWSPPPFREKEHIWIVYNQKSNAPAPLPTPTGLVVKSIRTPARELENGGIASGPCAGLRWAIPLSGERLLPEQPVRYMLQRQALGNGPTLNAIVDSSWQTIVQPDDPEVPTTVAIADLEAPIFFIDDPAAALAQLEADRFYAYRIAGVDLFGRKGPYSEPAIGDLTDQEPPPPPINLEAGYFERSDPALGDAEKKWLADNPSAASGLRIQWELPLSLRHQAPDTREFRAYAQRGRLNAIVGQVTQVTPNMDGTFTVQTNQVIPDDQVDAFIGESFLSGDVYFRVLHNTAGANFQVKLQPPASPPPAVPILGSFTLSMRPPRFLEGSISKVRKYFTGTGWRFTLTTDQVTNIPVNGLAGKWLRQSGQDYKIESNTSGSDFQIEVRGTLSSLPHSGNGGFAVVEDQVIDGVPTRVQVLADAGNPLYADYRRPESWAERLHIEPIAPPAKGKIIEVNVDEQSGIALVGTDQSLDDPAQRFDRGTLINNGQEFQVIAVTAGPKLEMTVSNSLDPNGIPILPALGTFEYYMGYQTIIPYDIGGVEDDPVSFAQVALSTADDKNYIPDNPRWNGTILGSRPGNEGMVTAPVGVQKGRRIQPQRPAAPDVGSGLATAANYDGQSFITLNWQNVNGMRYEIYRALDEAVFSADRNARPTRSTDRTAYPWLTDAAFDALITQVPDYLTLSDELLQALASLPGNESAFGLVTTAPIDANAYMASLNGRAINRYCFALRLVDLAGNKSVLGWPSKPAHVPNLTPPRAPVITKVLGGDRQITIKWASNREVDLKEYRIYRGDSEEAASDLRLMILLHNVSASPDNGMDENIYDDLSVFPGHLYWYRLVAVDIIGNASPPTVAMQASAYRLESPSPPVWVSAGWKEDGTAIHLEWLPNEPDLEFLIQRCQGRSPHWLAVSKWLERNTLTFDDLTANASTENHYRITSRDSAGNSSVDYIPRSVLPLLN